jgi:DNA mismatch repair ATPase MutS
MYKDKDFDPDQILRKRESNIRAWEKNQNLEIERILPWNEEDLRKDFGVDILLNSMAEGDNFLFEVGEVAILKTVSDPETIIYRQDILRDCITHEDIVRNIYALSYETIQKEKEIFHWGFLNRYPSGILHQAVGSLKLFVSYLRELHGIADKNIQEFQSKGFKRLFEMLIHELSEEYFSKIDEHLTNLEFKWGVLISAQLGAGNKGINYVLRKVPEDKHPLLTLLHLQKIPGYTFQIHPRDEAGARALSELRDQGVNQVANSLAQSTDHILSFIHALRTELAFYIGCMNLQKKLKEIEIPVCFPQLTKTGDSGLSFEELVDVSLALNMRKRIVDNNLSANGKNLIIITGANTGGKSTFLRSIGLAYLMMQSGMFVTAESFTAAIHSSIFTHFKREEDITMNKGKLDEELARIKSIIDKIDSKSIIFFNESFAATNEREGSEIAGQITKALIEKKISVIFVTHLYEFGHSFFEKKLGNALFLRAERLPDGTRTFKIIEGAPLQTSYGADVYRKIFQE